MIDHDNLEEFRDPQTYNLQDEGYYDDYPLTEQWARSLGVPLLDLACGTGRMALRMAELGYQVTGVDITPEMIGWARQKAAQYVRDVVFDGSLADNKLFRNFAIRSAFGDKTKHLNFTPGQVSRSRRRSSRIAHR
jgi:2-polyprenyl-3-methyl-5-hydroxy-6-metoxy-1,4-benzoquinol methylase